MEKRMYIVTGAGSGMGRAAALRLAEAPENTVIITGRQLNSLEETCSMASHSNVRAYALDIRDKQAWRKLYAKESASLSDLHGIFANAGIGGENSYGEEDRWDEIISINLTGTYTTIMEALPHLRGSRHKVRHIAITASCLARFGVAHYTAYCTAKTGLLGLTRSLAVELAADNILVNALCPGWVDTEMARAGIDKLAVRQSIPFEESLSIQKSLVPLNRISDPAEIAEMVAFLFSDRQTSMTGQGIDINNGSYMI